jgi:type I restriction enzyme S subunit
LWAWHRGLGVSEYHGIVSTAYGVYRPLKPEQWNHRYLNYLLRDKTYVGECLIRSKGIWESRYQLTGSNFLDISVLQPPLAIQNRIVAYLDKKNNEIDKFIRNKERLIENLKELKNQIIEKFITKGLNSSIEYSYSGLKLFGNVPTHWQVKRLRYVSKKVKTGTTPSGKVTDYFENGFYNWFTPGDFNEDYLLLDSERKVNAKALKDKEVSIFPANSVLIIGIGGTIGKVCLITSEASSNQQINAITFSNEIRPAYGLHLLGLIGRNLINILDFTTLPILNQGVTKDLLFLSPPIDEQDAIIREINKISISTKESISKIEQEIASIKEYREAIITDLVTGKRSVPQ